MRAKAKNQMVAVDMLQKYFQELGSDEAAARFFVDTLGPEGVACLLSRMSSVSAERNQEIDPALAELLGIKRFTPHEAKSLEVTSLYNFFKRRRELLDNSIGSIEAAEMLGVSKQTIHDRIRENKLIGLIESNVMRLPLFQFDPTGPDGTVSGLTEVLKDLSGSLLSKVSWLVTPNAVFDGDSPIHILRHGDTERVLREARSVGVA